MKPRKVQFDTEFEDDGLFSITFWFDQQTIPSYITIARDEVEDPDFIYIEAEDQKYGLKVTDLKFEKHEGIIQLKFDKNSENYFYWNKSKKIQIEIDDADMKNIERYFKEIFR